MNATRAVRTMMLVLALTSVACQESRVANPAAASLFIPNVEGVWGGPLTLLATSGGECVAGVVPTFLPTLDSGTFTISQEGGTLLGAITTESTGLACRYSGSATTSSLAMNATSCDRTGLIVTCLDGQARELRLVGSSVTAAWDGNQITGRTTSTYNVFANENGDLVGVGSLVATHGFTATRR
jgi:hypothetical protein